MTERRYRRSGSAPDFTDEAAVRAAAAEVRSLYETAAEAEESPEWRELRPRVARWVLATSFDMPAVGAEEVALKIARIYLVRPEILPQLPPPGAGE